MICNTVQKSFTANSLVIDISGWDYVVIQAVNPSGTISLTATLNGGASNNTTTAADFTTVQATKLSDGTAVTAIAAAGLYRIPVVGHYLKLSGASAAADAIYVMYAKISKQ